MRGVLSTMTIRSIEPRDRAAYLRMTHAFYHSDAVLHPVPDAYLETTFEALMAKTPFVSAYIFEEAGETVGYALTATTFSQEAGGVVLWVEELYVEEPYRSQGIGRQFLTSLTQSPPDGVKRIRLEVERENERAVKLYESLGFSFLGYDQMLIEYGEGSTPTL